MTDTPEFVQALGRVPSGLFIVTSACEGKRAAFLASFVQQASFEPLIFSVAVHPDRYPYQIIKKSGKFGLNIIAEGDHTLVKTFAKGHGPEEDPIADVEHVNVRDIPVFKDAIGSAVFEVTGEVKPGDHVIVFGRAVDGKFFDHEKRPRVHVRKSAKSY